MIISMIVEEREIFGNFMDLWIVDEREQDLRVSLIVFSNSSGFIKFRKRVFHFDYLARWSLRRDIFANRISALIQLSPWHVLRERANHFRFY